MTGVEANTESGKSPAPADELHDRLQRYVGATSGPPRVAPDAVNEPMIRHWCLALGDANPVYTEPAQAAVSRFGGVVAPPTMIQAWTHHDRRFPAPSGEDNAEEQLVEELAAAGFTSVVATGCRYHFPRYLRPGDRPTYQAVVRSISPRRTTRLGAGYFLTSEVTYRDGSGEIVGTIDFTTLRFDPRSSS